MRSPKVETASGVILKDEDVFSLVLIIFLFHLALVEDDVTRGTVRLMVYSLHFFISSTGKYEKP